MFNYDVITKIVKKYKFDTKSEQGRFQNRLLRLILINEYYKVTYLYYAKIYNSLITRKPYLDEYELNEPYQSFKNDIREIIISAILDESCALEDIVFSIYNHLHYKGIKNGERAILSILISYHRDYPKFINDTILVQN